MTERDGGLDGVLDPFGDDSWVSTEWKMLLTTWQQVRSVLLAGLESCQANFFLKKTAADCVVVLNFHPP